MQVDVRDMGLIPALGRSWRRAWQLTLVFLPGESHGQKSLAGYSPWGHRSQLKRLSTQHAVLSSAFISICFILIETRFPIGDNKELSKWGECPVAET